MARLRAKLMNPETAYAELVEQLRFAMVQAGKPCLSTLGKQVGYSKATLSKVFTGKAMPSWVLVQRLGELFGIPADVVDEWYTLWTAANMHSRKPPVTSASTVRDTGTAPARDGTGTAAPRDGGGTAAAREGETGYKCPKCGSWVVDTALHTGWHMEVEPSGRPVPPTESIRGWHAGSEDNTLLGTALGPELR